MTEKVRYVIRESGMSGDMTIEADVEDIEVIFDW